MWPFSNPDHAFRKAVLSEFAPLATECGSNLQKVAPMIYGFRTHHAILTVGAYPGHFRSLCVKLRPSGKEEVVCVRDEVDIGLANFELFVTGKVSEVYSEREHWRAGALRKEVEALARKVREVAMPFLTTSRAKWDGVRDMIAANISEMLDEQKS